MINKIMKIFWGILTLLQIFCVCLYVCNLLKILAGLNSLLLTFNHFISF